MGSMADLDRRGISRPHRDSIPGPFSLWRVAIPTTLSRPPLIASTDVDVDGVAWTTQLLVEFIPHLGLWPRS